MGKSWSMKVGAVSLGTEPAGAPVARDPQAPFRILLLGNFRGHARSAQPVASRRPVLVDRDNVDQVLAQLAPELHLALPGAPPLTVRFTDLDSFHPDQLYQRLEVFTALRGLHERLANPRTFADAAAELRAVAATPQETAPDGGAAPPPADLTALSPEQLLEQVLGGSLHPAEARPAPVPAAAADWQNYLQRLVQSHTVPNIDAEQEQLLAQVDQAAGAQMRALLHHPDFQALEAAWRSVDFLARRLDTDASLKLSLLDLSGEELSADLETPDLQSSTLHRLLVEQTVQTPGGQPWAVLAGHYTFGKTRDDAVTLARLGWLAARAGAAFLAAARRKESPSPGPEPREDEKGWQELRGLGEAAYLGLAWPRFLLRLPYGAETTPTESFHFEELVAEGPLPAESYLWGNPAVLCALLLGEAFRRSGWGLRPGEIHEVAGLPLHVYRDEGESAVRPCAEQVLTGSAVDRLLDEGLIPVIAVLQQDRVALGRFQSLANPPQSLAGPWQ